MQVTKQIKKKNDTAEANKGIMYASSEFCTNLQNNF